jgi:hypothetical protein
MPKNKGERRVQTQQAPANTNRGAPTQVSSGQSAFQKGVGRCSAKCWLLSSVCIKTPSHAFHQSKKASTYKAQLKRWGGTRDTGQSVKGGSYRNNQNPRHNATWKERGML